MKKRRRNRTHVAGAKVPPGRGRDRVEQHLPVRDDRALRPARAARGVQHHDRRVEREWRAVEGRSVVAPGVLCTGPRRAVIDVEPRHSAQRGVAGVVRATKPGLANDQRHACIGEYARQLRRRKTPVERHERRADPPARHVQRHQLVPVGRQRRHAVAARHPARNEQRGPSRGGIVQCRVREPHAARTVHQRHLVRRHARPPPHGIGHRAERVHRATSFRRAGSGP